MATYAAQCRGPDLACLGTTTQRRLDILQEGLSSLDRSARSSRFIPLLLSFPPWSPSLPIRFLLSEASFHVLPERSISLTLVKGRLLPLLCSSFDLLLGQN